MFSELNVVSRTEAVDYHAHTPQSKESGRAMGLAMPHDRREDGSTSIIQDSSGTWVVHHRITPRKDIFSRKITTSIVIKAKDLESALHIFDARAHLLEWAENHWHDRPGGSREDLAATLKKTKPKTTEADLAGWNVKKVTKREEVPDSRSRLSKLFNVGKPPEPQIKEVGRIYTKA